MDSNDLVLGEQVGVAKVCENLKSIQQMQESGLRDYSTYGFWDYFVLMEEMCTSQWLEISASTGCSVGTGFIAFSLIARLSLVPLGLYQQVVAQKMKKLQEQLTQFSAEIREHQGAGRQGEAMLLAKKHKQFQVRNGIYQKLQFLNLFQIPLHITNFSLLMSISRDPSHPLYEALSTGGQFWFTNLLAPDPISALPIIAAVLQVANMR